MIYVTNTGSDTVSIVDGKVDGTIERLNFNINPPKSGDIQCNGQTIMQSTLPFTGTVRICSVQHADAGEDYGFNCWSNIAFGSSNPLDLRVSQYGGDVDCKLVTQ